MTREQIDERLDDVRKLIRKNQDDTLNLNDAAVLAEAAFRKRKLENLLKAEVTRLKGADERKAMAEELASDEWLTWQLAKNKAKYKRELIDNLLSEQSSVQTQARLLISEMQFERTNWEP